jgi:hypothetical protein
MHPGDTLGLRQRGLRCGSERMSMCAADIQLYLHTPVPTRIRSNMDTPRQVGAQIRNMRQQRSRTVPNPGKAQPAPDRLAAGIPVRDEIPVNGIRLRARR